MTNHLQSSGRSVRTRAVTSALVVAALALTGCTSMSGLGGSSNYACKAPEGVTCDSVSGTYANAVQDNLPSQRRAASTGTSMPAAPRAAEGLASAAASAAMGSAAARIALPPATAATPTAIPLRSSARILRLWFKPWEDADRDLHDQGYVYVRVDDGQWLVDHAQRQIRNAYAALRPPPRATGGTAEPRDAATPSRPAGALRLPGLTPPAGRPQPPADPSNSD